MDQILLNQEDSIEIEIYFNGVLTNPSSIKIKTIQDQDGDIRVTNDTNITQISTGRYKYTIDSSVSDELGVYTALWEFVISGITYIHEQKYEVVSLIREGYVTPQELKDDSTINLNGYTNVQLQKYIKKATGIIDTYLGDTVNYQQYNETIRCVLDKRTGGLHIQLRHKPIVSVTSVSVVTHPLGGSITIDPNDLRINEKAGYLEYYGTTAISTLKVVLRDFTTDPIVPEATVSYTAGYTSVPDRVKQATVALVEQLLNIASGDDKSLASFTLDTYTERFTESSVKGVGEIGKDPVFELLRGYRQPMRGTGFFGPLG
jgi:hypothetical protein